MDRKDSPNCTELEHHIIDHFTGLPGWDDSGWIDMPEDEHCLQEFHHGWSEAKDAYASTPEEIELIDKAIAILAADIEGSFEYTSSGCLIIIKAMETFGL